MSAITERDVEIDCCYLCHGIWLDAGELSALFDAHATEPSQETMADFAGTFFFDSISRDDLFCPCCMEELVDTPFGEGHISVCVTCGGMFIESATLDLILPDPANILSRIRNENSRQRGLSAALFCALAGMLSPS